MNATNAEIYKLVLPDAPYVVAAYAILWLTLVIYVSMVLRRIMRLEKEVSILESDAQRRSTAAQQ